MASLAMPKAGVTGDEMPMERNAGLIMGTNNSSIVSKRSVEKLYLPQPHFYRYFVRKPIRRSPTINRGYWLRMRAIDWVVRQFLEKPTDLKKVVINLGCGYDPLPFQWMAHHGELCNDTKFIDVDFEELMISKREVILNTPQMRNMLSDVSEVGLEKGIILDSKEYTAIGCDLRNLRRFERLLKTVTELENCLILCVAEVSITYMATKDADALIHWTTTLSPDVTFCLLEQQSPDRADHPFTATMLKHFAKLGTPLRSVLQYPGCHTQTLRFQDAGFTHIEVQNLWELWADPRFLSPSVRMSLDAVEPFDEWEEFALFGSHYILMIAQTGPEPLIPDKRGRSRRASIDSVASDFSARTASPHRDVTQWFAYKYSANPEKEGRGHHGVAYKIEGKDVLCFHGGVGLQNRLSTTSVYAPTTANYKYPPVAPEDIGPRCCHSVTPLGSDDSGQLLLVGGRASPSAPLKDCWLQTDTGWRRVHDLPEPRFRHRATQVFLPHHKHGVLVFGGKTSATKIALDTLLWDEDNGWQVLRSLLQDPMPRFGSSFVRLGFNHGLIIGGMRQDGVICQGLWKWRLIIRDDQVKGINFKTSTALDASVGMWPWLNRFGASWSLIRDELLLIGGVGKHGCIPQDYEILSIVGSFSAFNEYEKEMEFRATCVVPKNNPDIPRPLLIGHATQRTGRGTTLIMGGGAVCFSFGAYWNPGCWVLYDREAGMSSHWALMKPQIKDDTSQPPNPPLAGVQPAISTSVQHISLQNDADFIHILQESIPKLMKDVDFGSCRSRWTPDYLLSKVAAEKLVVIHAAPSRTMNFQRKDFAYKTTSFHDFVKQLQSDPQAHMYLRSISSSNPTSSPADFSTDWPELSPDFHLPTPLSFIKSHQHSSPLRISADVNMWLHYDVMANVLFQIRGTRKLILFPPSDLKYLSFPPGATSSTIDIFQSTASGEEDTEISIPNTHPHAAILKPGEALFLPPLWSHTARPLPPSPQRKAFPSRPASQASVSDTSTASMSISQSAPLPSTLTPSTDPIPSTIGTNPEAEEDPADSRVNISLNVFFRTLHQSKYAAGRDVYGNRDLGAYEDGRRDVEKIVKRFLTKSKDDSGGSGEGNLDMSSISKDVTKAYLERLAAEIQERADKL